MPAREKMRVIDNRGRKAERALLSVDSLLVFGCDGRVAGNRERAGGHVRCAHGDGGGGGDGEELRGTVGRGTDTRLRRRPASATSCLPSFLA